MYYEIMAKTRKTEIQINLSDILRVCCFPPSPKRERTIQQESYFCHRKNFEKFATSKHKHLDRVCAPVNIMYIVTQKVKKHLSKTPAVYSFPA